MQPTVFPRDYRIVVRGRLGERLVRALGGVRAVDESGPTTTLTASVPDVTALYGLLDRLRDLGIELESVHADG